MFQAKALRVKPPTVKLAVNAPKNFLRTRAAAAGPRPPCSPPPCCGLQGLRPGSEGRRRPPFLPSSWTWRLEVRPASPLRLEALQSHLGGSRHWSPSDMVAATGEPTLAHWTVRPHGSWTATPWHGLQLCGVHLVGPSVVRKARLFAGQEVT